MPRQTLYNAETLKAILESPGEVTIGAWARRHRRRQWLIALSGVALIALAATLYVVLSFGGEMEPVEGYAVELRCFQCAHEEGRRVAFGQEFPLMCPRCNERSLQPLWECRECGERFLPTGSPESVSCPACGSKRVGSAAAPPALPAEAPPTENRAEKPGPP